MLKLRAPVPDAGLPVGRLVIAAVSTSGTEARADTTGTSPSELKKEAQASARLGGYFLLGVKEIWGPMTCKEFTSSLLDQRGHALPLGITTLLETEQAGSIAEECVNEALLLKVAWHCGLRTG
eukprot:symbB.v1.2.033392.t3/scaffold4117.1/size72747/1